MGTSRIAIVFPSLHLVVKLPSSRPLNVVKEIHHNLNNGQWKNPVHWRLLWTWLLWPMGVAGSASGELFKGLVENWLEFRFWLKTHHPFLQPTYFSLFGLLNLQRADLLCSLNDTDLWCQMVELTDEKVCDDSHHFSNPANFSLRDGKLRMHDYGGRKCHRVISDYGVKISEQFDPSYNFQEVMAERERNK